jgi:hypothetical protein
MLDDANDNYGFNVGKCKTYIELKETDMIFTCKWKRKRDSLAGN